MGVVHRLRITRGKFAELSANALEGSGDCAKHQLLKATHSEQFGIVGPAPAEPARTLSRPSVPPSATCRRADTPPTGGSGGPAKAGEARGVAAHRQIEPARKRGVGGG